MLAAKKLKTDKRVYIRRYRTHYYVGKKSGGSEKPGGVLEFIYKYYEGSQRKTGESKLYDFH